MFNREYIKKMAADMREDALTMAVCAGKNAAHFGGGVSYIDILAVLYGAVMRLDCDNPEWEDRDYFILSKGHGVLGYYAALCESGFIEKEELCSFEKSGSALLGHPVQNRKKGIEFTTGSLGQGLSIGIGVAISLREKGMDSKVYVLMGDGECDEGSVWEALMAAAHYKLDNMVVIIDRNQYQLGGLTKETMSLGNLSSKIQAFGWQTKEIDGHDIDAIYNALNSAEHVEKPMAVIANTIKGYGFSFCQGNNSFHHAVITQELYKRGMEELGRTECYDEWMRKSKQWEIEHGCALKEKNNSKETYKTSIEITPGLAKRWGLIGQRASFGLAVMELKKNHPRMKVLTADVSTSAGLERYRKKYPEDFIDTGIAEQNMMGIATGLSQMGCDVITATFASFQSMRCLEQIRVNEGYMQTKVVMVGLASGLALGTLGSTHCCFEDVGVLRSIPNIAIVSPADAGEVGKALEAALAYPSSVYIRLMGGSNCPVLYQENYNFEIGKAILMKKATDRAKEKIVIFSTGTMVRTALETAEKVESTEISAEVYNMHTIKPIDKAVILKACENARWIVAIEEHNVLGGMASAISEVMVQTKNEAVLMRYGISDQYNTGGEYEDLLACYGLTAETIAMDIKRKICI